jgi:hypothetical protein
MSTGVRVTGVVVSGVAIIEDSDIIDESVAISLDDIIEEGISDDIIEDSADELESWAIAAPPTTSAASAVVAKSIRFIVSSLGSTSVGHAARRSA